MGRPRKKQPMTNEEVDAVFKNTNSGVTPMSKLLDSIRIDVKPKTENQKELIKSIKENEITIASGLAGTGKTFLTCAEALKLLKNQENSYSRIILVKSVTTLKDEEIGYLKGSLIEKMEPFMYSFIGNFEKLIGKGNTAKLRELGLIEILPIAYLRGINIDNAIILVDECQNITKRNMRTILTRLGQNSKMVFLGDEKQIDIKNPKESALEFLMDRFDHINGIGSVRLKVEDILRNPLIKEIENVFESVTDEETARKTPKEIIEEVKKEDSNPTKKRRGWW